MRSKKVKDCTSDEEQMLSCLMERVTGIENISFCPQIWLKSQKAIAMLGIKDVGIIL